MKPEASCWALIAARWIQSWVRCLPACARATRSAIGRLNRIRRAPFGASRCNLRPLSSRAIKSWSFAHVMAIIFARSKRTRPTVESNSDKIARARRLIMTTPPKTKGLLLRPALVLLIVLMCSTLALAQTRKTTPEKEEPSIPTFVVRGRVVFDDTDRPVRRSQIALMRFPVRGEQSSSVTDRDGKFVIEGVPSGMYFAWINSPGIIAPFAFMKIGENGPEDAVNVKAIKEYCTEVIVSGSDVDVTIHARRGGIIQGKVTYSNGGRAINPIMVIGRKDEKKPVRVFAGLSAAGLLSAHTDDRGRYRISGLPPGEYIVSAAEKNTVTKNLRARRDMGGLDSLFGSSDALAVAYYGGAGKIDDALRLQVEANSELADIDVTLADTTPHTIHGSVIAKLDRIALPGDTLNIRRPDQTDWFAQNNQQVRTDEQGVWVLEDVPDGVS